MQNNFVLLITDVAGLVGDGVAMFLPGTGVSTARLWCAADAEKLYAWFAEIMVGYIFGSIAGVMSQIMTSLKGNDQEFTIKLNGTTALFCVMITAVYLVDTLSRQLELCVLLMLIHVASTVAIAVPLY